MGLLSMRNVFLSGTAKTSRTNVSPVADFTADVVTGVMPVTVNFTDTSTNSPTSWAWDFNNDGTVDSTAQNPSYTYTEAGTYTVKLTASNLGGSGEVVKTGFITVALPAPTANFTSSTTTGVVPFTVNFTDTSTNSPTAWAWDFNNDGVTDSTLQNPSYTYSSVGTYAVKLTATNSTGAGQTTKLSYVTVNPPAPVSNFTVSPSSGAVPLTVNFTDTSTNTPTAWVWDFNNDGVTDSTSQNPSFTYTTAGTYTVKLTASNVTGSNQVTKTNVITVLQPVYTLSRSAATVNEGASVTITLTTQYVSPGTVVPYTISGTGITTADIGGASLTGNFTVSGTFNSGTASVTLNITADTLTEGAETILLSITQGGQSVSVSINDTSVAPVSTYAVYFDGNGDYLTLSASTPTQIATGDFTIEFWVKANTSQPGGNARLLATNDWGTTAGFDLCIEASKLQFRSGGGSSKWCNWVSADYNKWQHIAFARTGTTFRVFKNGVLQNTFTDSSNLSAGKGLRIAANNVNAETFAGYISNLHIVKGTCKYTANFTPVVIATKITNTSLLTCQGSTIVDNSGNNYAITKYGNSTAGTLVSI